MAEAIDTRACLALGGMALGSAPRIADDLVGLFDRVGRLPHKLQWVHREIAADLGQPLDAALDRACCVVAETIDANPRAFDRHPYHNRQHFCEVALTAYILCLLNQQGARATQLVLLAALLHDFVHEGAPSEAFVLERASVDQARGALVRAGLSPADIRRVTALVLATDVVQGNAFMAAVCRVHADGRSLAPAVPAAAPELADLLVDRELAQQARILCEADILPSIGLNLAHALCVQDRLAKEWGRPLDAADKLAFIDAVLGHGFIGPFFLPNVQATRAALAAGSHAAGVD